MSRSSINSIALFFAASLIGACSLSGPAAVSDGSYPASVTNRYARALGYMDAGKDSRAQREFEAIGQAYPEYAGAHVNLGIIHERAGRPDAAEAAFRRALEVCSECAPAYNHLGIMQRHKGSFDEARESYLHAIESDADYALAYYNLGILFDLYLGRPELALQYYEAYVERESNASLTGEVRKWIIDLQRRIGAPRRAARTAGAQ